MHRRLFVALVPPAEVIEHLDRGVAAVRREIGDGPVSSAGVPLLRWTTREQWHLTLVFLGNVDDALRPALERRLRRAAARHRPLRLFLQGAGRFGGPAASRVLWTGVGGEAEPLRRLARSVHAAAARSGLDVGEARFRAHVTLARLREPTDIRPIVERLNDYSGPEFVADRVSLIGSHLGQGEGRRPRYETVASWEIGGEDRPPER